ncbi:HAMP domain-containing protein [Nonomuraea jabiensis]|uniref:HAMP domain-containing protein n=1 Tax=Nonomuraea jabiensis TaxID=882448 RepID=UPI003D741052
MLVRRGLRPLTRIEKTAEDIAGGNLDLRIASARRHTGHHGRQGFLRAVPTGTLRGAAA